jgi:predicted metal-dependent phosphoesterase TrpH
MIRVEFHCHTHYSKDSLLHPQHLLEACRRKGIHRVVVTDHNNNLGGLHAQRLDPHLAIPGEEVQTTAGELLAFFVSEEVPRDLPPREAILRLRDQGAFISVSHPYDVLRSGSWEEKDLLEILPLVDAIETFNARCMSANYNTQAQAFAQEHGLLGTAGSDAHAGFEVGRATLLLPKFHDAASLKAILAQAQFDVRLSSPWVHFTSRYAVWYKKRFKPEMPLTS